MGSNVILVAIEDVHGNNIDTFVDTYPVVNRDTKKLAIDSVIKRYYRNTEILGIIDNGNKIRVRLNLKGIHKDNIRRGA